MKFEMENYNFLNEKFSSNPLGLDKPVLDPGDSSLMTLFSFLTDCPVVRCLVVA